MRWRPFFIFHAWPSQAATFQINTAEAEPHNRGPLISRVWLLLFLLIDLLNRFAALPVDLHVLLCVIPVRRQSQNELHRSLVTIIIPRIGFKLTY